MKTRMGGNEFAHWKAIYEVEGFGSQRTDHQFAALSALIANVNRDPNKSAYRIIDFMPDWWKAVQTSQMSLADKFRMIASSVGVTQVTETKTNES